MLCLCHGLMCKGNKKDMHYGGVLHAVHKVCTGPYPSCIVVRSTSNNEPCYESI